MNRRQGGIAMMAALACMLSPALAAAQPASESAQVSSTTVSSPMPSGFTGVSVEFQALHAYTGRDPKAVNPVLTRLLRELAPGQAPVLRIGGNSADQTWWPVRGVIAPGGVAYTLTGNWLRTTRALADAAGARLIVGINLATARPSLAADEARAILRGVGPQYISDLEIGNEPDLFGQFVWYRDRHGHLFSARPRSYNLKAFIRDFSHWRAALPSVPLAGPSFAGLTWMSGLSEFLSAEPGLGVVTFHRYPLRACDHNPASPGYPTIPALLSDSSSQGIAQQVAPYVAIAHDRGLPFRMDEINSVACRGKPGVSDTFASALWALDTLFNFASVGVDGVNVHTLPGAAYELFSFSHHGSSWSAFVHPEYYGMMVFSQAFPPGAQLLSVNAPPGPVKVWATQNGQGPIRVTLINKGSAATVVNVQLPGIPTAASAQSLSAPSIGSKSGVDFGGQSLGSNGLPHGTAMSTAVNPVGTTYSVKVPAGSAILLTR